MEYACFICSGVIELTIFTIPKYEPLSNWILCHATKTLILLTAQLLNKTAR